MTHPTPTVGPNQLAPTEPHRDHCVLRLPAGLPYERWVIEGENLLREIKDGPWYLGDWFLFGTTHFSENQYTAALTVTSRSLQTMYNCRSVAKTFPPPRRRAGLTWGHHQAAQGLPEAEADALLRRAEEEGWSVDQLRAAKRGEDDPVPKISTRDKLEEVTTALLGVGDHKHEDVVSAANTLRQTQEKLPSAGECRVCRHAPGCPDFETPEESEL